MAVQLVARLAAKFRKRFPGPRVRICRAKLPDEFATCHFDSSKNQFVVTLDKGLSDEVALFILAHEWAHALSWGIDEDDHGPAFWAAYQKTYAVYEQFADHHNGNTHE